MSGILRKTQDGGTSAYTLDVVHFLRTRVGVDQGDTIPDAAMISPLLDMVQEVVHHSDKTHRFVTRVRGDVDCFASMWTKVRD